MDPQLIERIRADMRYEFERTGPPPGFPAFHDIATQRHTSVDFHELQTSMSSPALRGITVNYQERRIWHLHEQIDRTIGVEKIPPDWRVAQLLAPYVEDGATTRPTR